MIDSIKPGKSNDPSSKEILSNFMPHIHNLLSIDKANPATKHADMEILVTHMLETHHKYIIDHSRIVSTLFKRDYEAVLIKKATMIGTGVAVLAFWLGTMFGG